MARDGTVELTIDRSTSTRSARLASVDGRRNESVVLTFACFDVAPGTPTATLTLCVAAAIETAFV